MKPFLYNELSRRERQIMDILFRMKEASVGEILGQLPDSPPYNSVRVILTILEKKGHVSHQRVGQRYVYWPTHGEDSVKRSALKHMVSTFFDGSPIKMLSTLLDESTSRLSESDLKELSNMIEKAKKDKQK